MSLSPGLTVSNVVSRDLSGEKGEAAIEAMAGFFTGLGIAWYSVSGGLHVEAGPGDTLLCLPGRVVANREVSPDVARIIVGCARALDWSAVVADGDQNSLDNLIVAGVPEELAVVNRPASSGALSIIRRQYGALLLHMTEPYDRLGAVPRSVRLHQAAWFRRAMAYGPRLAEQVAATLPSQAKRQTKKQFQKALSYRPGLPKGFHDTPPRQNSYRPSTSASVVNTGPHHASAGSHQANRPMSLSREQFVASLAYIPAAYGRPSAILENEPSIRTTVVRTGTTNEMRSALVQDQEEANQPLEVPKQPKLHPGPIGTEGSLDIELMPEDRIKPADVAASQVNRELRARYEFEQERNRNAAQASAEKLRLASQGPPKPKRGKR